MSDDTSEVTDQDLDSPKQLAKLFPVYVYRIMECICETFIYL